MKIESWKNYSQTIKLPPSPVDSIRVWLILWKHSLHLVLYPYRTWIYLFEACLFKVAFTPPDCAPRRHTSQSQASIFEHWQGVKSTQWVGSLTYRSWQPQSNWFSYTGSLAKHSLSTSAWYASHHCPNVWSMTTNWHRANRNGEKQWLYASSVKKSCNLHGQ